MNMVTAMAFTNILAFVVLIVAGGLLASPTVGFATLLVIPLFLAATTPLFQGTSATGSQDNTAATHPPHASTLRTRAAVSNRAHSFSPC